MGEKHERGFRGSFSSMLSGSGKYLIHGFGSGQHLRINTQRLGRFLLFYLIFYTVLASMSFSLWWMFSLTLNPRTPRRLTTDSLIGTSPGLGFRPLPSREHNVLSSLIWYQGTKNESFQFWTQSLIDFLEVYKKPGLTPGRGQNIYNCDYDRPPNHGQVCDVNVKDFGPCIDESYFMYHQSSPCIFLKLNKIYGWVPEYYKNPNRLPADMPETLKKHIQGLLNETDSKLRRKLETIWVTCSGESPADAEFIGSVDYYPRQGFPGYFFPYENSEGYLSPLVAVHFKRPKPGILINIECRAWAENIHYRKRDKQGSVHFELMID